MKSIKEFLDNSIKFDSSNVNRQIAKQLLKSYSTDIFLSLKAIAKNSFCSESAITKYCKKMGVSGYKELCFSLKMEKEKYLRKNVDELGANKNYIFDYLDFIKQEITNQSIWIENFKKVLVKYNKIILFSCYQLMDIASFFREYSEFKGIEVKFSTIRHFEGTNIDYAIEYNDALILFFISGQDNDWIISTIYEKIKVTRKREIFIIASKSQKNKVDAKNIYQLNSYKFYSGYEYRRIYLDILFILLFENYKVF